MAAAAAVADRAAWGSPAATSARSPARCTAYSELRDWRGAGRSAGGSGLAGPGGACALPLPLDVLRSRTDTGGAPHKPLCDPPLARLRRPTLRPPPHHVRAAIHALYHAAGRAPNRGCGATHCPMQHVYRRERHHLCSAEVERAGCEAWPAAPSLPEDPHPLCEPCCWWASAAGCARAVALAPQLFTSWRAALNASREVRAQAVLGEWELIQYE